MPRENRKRGKKNKKKAEEDPRVQQTEETHPPEADFEEQEAGPSWIVPDTKQEREVDLDAPFGYIDADVKAYFRTVDVQIRNWQEHDNGLAEGYEDVDPNEEKRLFFVAALTEMSGKEKQLATDPDCSNILERMSYSMDDFVRRVFVDSLAGSYEVLAKHRFSSHVCQTLLTVAADTVDRECRGVVPSVPDSSEHGELLTLSKLVLHICEELRTSFTTLIMDPFASHVIRSLLLLLSPSLRISDAGPLSSHKSQSFMRSKKSAAFKARLGSMKSVFQTGKAKDQKIAAKSTPAEFRQAAHKFVQVIRDELGENEVRALAADKVASPVLQLLLEIEAEQGLDDEPNSLMDRVLVGIITAYHNDPRTAVEASDYLSTLLRDPTSSHLLETLVTRAPDRAFAILWDTYFQGKLARLAVHPVANFVVARAMERATADQLGAVFKELDGVWGKIIKSSRAGVLRAVIDRTSALHAHEQAAGEAVYRAFDLDTNVDRNMLVPCAMRLKPLEEYRSLLEASMESLVKDANDSHHGKHRRDKGEDPMEPKTQGALLLQSLLRLSEPHNAIVTDSIGSLSTEELLALAQNPTSSRVLDILLESSTVPFKSKRVFVMSFIGHYHLLVDDRIGSRVGDRCWAFADPYLKEKIARSLIPHEQFLAGSYYGKFFARNLNLYLLQRRPAEWKDLQVKRKAESLGNIPNAEEAASGSVSLLAEQVSNKRKRNTRPEHEIDALFDAALGKKTKKGLLDMSDTRTTGHSTTRTEAASRTEKAQEHGLTDVLGAIRAAPKDEKSHRKRKRVM